MTRRLLLGLATSAAMGLALSSGARAFEASAYTVSAPLSHGNLSVYAIRGTSAGGPVPLTLDEALGSGTARINVSNDRFTIENFSDRHVFVQVGDLIRGGLQDQVIGTSVLVPPGSGPVPLVVFCVDEGRSVARGLEDPATMAAANAAVPSQVARSIMLASGRQSIPMLDLRQVGVWMSARAIEQALSQRIGVTVTTDQAKNSLPLALAHDGVAQALQPALEALAAAVSGPGVVGIAAAIDGRIVGVDIYGSNALLVKMWPKLLRAYATEAIVTERAATAPPSVDRVAALLASPAADSGPVHVSETASASGEIVHRLYVPRFADASLPLTHEATALRLVELGLADLGVTVSRSPTPAPRAANLIPFVNAVHDARLGATQDVSPDIAAAANEYFQRTAAEQRAAAAVSGLAAHPYRHAPSLPFLVMMAIPIVLAAMSMRAAIAGLASRCAALSRRLAYRAISPIRWVALAATFAAMIVLIAVRAMVRLAGVACLKARAALDASRTAATPARLATT